jgi:P27 family predicted phage terminase small subunit
MSKGRKRLPTAVKDAKGTMKEYRRNPEEPDYVTFDAIPPPPPYVNGAGRDEYYRTAAELHAKGIMTQVSFRPFVAYCTQVAIYFDAVERLNETGTVIMDDKGQPRVNPYAKIANDALSLMLRLAVEFGLTPASSSKVHAREDVRSEKSDLIRRLQGNK